MTGGQCMVVLIVLIAVIGGIVKSRHRHERRIGKAGDGTEAAQLRHQVSELKDRIAVLERVITDNHSTADLDRQIKRLRDRT